MASHKHAVSFKKGDSIVIEGAACNVTSINISRPGKHGHAKVRIEATGIVDGKKRVLVAPGHDDIAVPTVDKRNAQVLSINGNQANVMDMETYETFDLEIPENLKGAVTEGVTVLYWIILSDKMMKQVKNG